MNQPQHIDKKWRWKNIIKYIRRGGEVTLSYDTVTANTNNYPPPPTSPHLRPCACGRGRGSARLLLSCTTRPHRTSRRTSDQSLRFSRLRRSASGSRVSAAARVDVPVWFQVRPSISVDRGARLRVTSPRALCTGRDLVTLHACPASLLPCRPHCTHRPPHALGPAVAPI